MIFYNIAICSLNRSYPFRNICFKLRISHFTKVVRADNLRSTERSVINNKVFFHKNRTFLNNLNRFHSSNDIKEEKPIPWSDGICDKLVKSSGPLQPYLRLIRLDKPTGIY